MEQKIKTDEPVKEQKKYTFVFDIYDNNKLVESKTIEINDALTINSAIEKAINIIASDIGGKKLTWKHIKTIT